MADGVRIVWDEAAWNRVFNSPDGITGQYLAKIAQQISNRAKQLAPVDTGRLRNSIDWNIGSVNNKITAHIGTNVEYARYVEFGTRYWSGQPFLIPALMEVVNRMRRV